MQSESKYKLGLIFSRNKPSPFNAVGDVAGNFEEAKSRADQERWRHRLTVYCTYLNIYAISKNARLPTLQNKPRSY